MNKTEEFQRSMQSLSECMQITELPKSHQTICGTEIQLSGLTEDEIGLVTQAFERYNQKTEWTRFAEWYVRRSQALNIPASSLVYEVLQDLESRLGIDQKKVSSPKEENES